MFPLIVGYEFLLGAVACIVSLFPAVVVLRAAPLLVVTLPVVLEEGSSGLVVEALEWGPSCKALLQDAFNHCSSLGEQFDSFFHFIVIEGDGWF